MSQLFRSIFLLLVLAIFYQCSSVQKTTVATNQQSQIKEIAIPEVIPDIAQVDTTLLVDSDSTIIIPDSTIIKPEFAEIEGDSTIINPDSLLAGQDSLIIDSDSINLADSVATPVTNILEAPVQYSAQDSIIFTANNMGFLYGEADIKYGEMGISGEFITMDMDSSLISSTFGVDTLGVEFGHPVFIEGGTEYEMKGVKYNFETRKAFIHNVITQQGEGHIVANEAKKNADNSFYMRNAKYTTCDRHDHPHFYLNLSKAKVRPD